MALGLPSSHRKYADFGESRVTDLGTHQCCILATQGKIINANHVPITLSLTVKIFFAKEVTEVPRSTAIQDTEYSAVSVNSI